MNKKLARVSSASLNILDRGILTFWVHADYEDGCSQGVGGFALDQWNKDAETRQGTVYGCELIRQVLTLFKVNDFSEIRGQMVYVLGEGNGLAFTPKGFERINLDKEYKSTDVVDFVKLAEEFME